MLVAEGVLETEEWGYGDGVRRLLVYKAGEGIEIRAWLDDRPAGLKNASVTALRGNNGVQLRSRSWEEEGGSSRYRRKGGRFGERAMSQEHLLLFVLASIWLQLTGTSEGFRTRKLFL